MTAPHPPGERPSLRTLVPVPLLTALLAAAAVGGAVAVAPASARLALAGGTGAAALALIAAVAVATHAVQTAKLLRRRLDSLTKDTGRMVQERVRLAEEFNQERGRLTDESVRERARVAEGFARERARLTEELEEERRRSRAERTRLTEERAQLAEEVRKATGERAAAISVTAGVAGRLQALATGTLADLRAMEERHADEDVLTDLLHLDHRTAQAGRLADSIAVLAGARSGRRWARPIVMESILRGAMGRIGGYRRVRLHSSSEAAVAGHAAEGVMHALAELLDNAANFSPPTAEVHVYVEEVPSGVIVSVEDSGLVMSDVQLRRAERAVSGEDGDLTSLSGTRLGLAVVGRLARKYGLRVSFRPSARGGTGVLMLIPQELLAGAPVSAPVPASVPSAAPVRSAAPVPSAAPVRSRSSARPPLTDPDPTPPRTHVLDSDLSYAAGRALQVQDQDLDLDLDLDLEPAPSHDSPNPPNSPDAPKAPTGELFDALPKRRHGRHLAEAETRARMNADANADANTDTTADSEADSDKGSTPRPTDHPVTSAARFGSFRNAVRGTAPDQAAVQGSTTAAAPAAAAPWHSHPDPEGDPTP